MSVIRLDRVATGVILIQQNTGDHVSRCTNCNNPCSRSPCNFNFNFNDLRFTCAQKL